MYDDEEENQTKKQPVKLNTYIDTPNWYAVCKAFQKKGYEPPDPDYPGAKLGAYASNIVSQYQADLSQQEVLKIIDDACFWGSEEEWEIRQRRKQMDELLGKESHERIF